MKSDIWVEGYKDYWNKKTNPYVIDPDASPEAKEWQLGYDYALINDEFKSLIEELTIILGKQDFTRSQLKELKKTVTDNISLHYINHILYRMGEYV